MQKEQLLLSMGNTNTLPNGKSKYSEKANNSEIGAIRLKEQSNSIDTTVTQKQQQQNKISSRFRISIMKKVGIPLLLGIIFTGLLDIIAIRYTLSFIYDQSKIDFLTQELFSSAALNYQQAQVVQNQVQLIVTSLHQLKSLNDLQKTYTTVWAPATLPYSPYYDQSKEPKILTQKNCAAAPSCDSTPDSISWYQDSFSTSRAYDYYLYFVPCPSASATAAKQAMQNYFEEFYQIARPIFKSLKGYADYIQIWHQSGVEMIYSTLDFTTTYLCTYDFSTNGIYVNTKNYASANSKMLLEHVKIDSTASSIDEQIQTVFCIQLDKMQQCTTSSAKPCGQICIKTSKQINRIVKLLARNVGVQNTDILLTAAQENSSQEVFNNPNKDTAGNNLSFKNFYDILFGTIASTAKTAFVSMFSNRIYPYTPAVNADEDQELSSYYDANNEENAVLFSYVKVDGGVNTATTPATVLPMKILYVLVTKYLFNAAMDPIESIVEDAKGLRDLWIGVTISTTIFCLVSLYLVSKIVMSIDDPIKTLTLKVKQIQDANLEVNLLVGFTSTFKEINELYHELEDINLQIKYCTDKFYNKSEAENLVNYTNAINIYQNLKNQKILGILFNNLGNIHARNQRYLEAISCFHTAVKISEKELRKLIRFDYPEIFYKAKRVLGWKYFLEHLEPASPIGWLEEEEKISEINGKKCSRVNVQLKKKLEEVYCNRLFSLANVTLLQGQIEKEETAKIRLFEQAIDYLNLVESVDKNLDNARSRSIKINFKLSTAYINRAKLTFVEENWFEGIDSLQKASSKFNYYQTVHNLFREKIIQRKNQLSKNPSEDFSSLKKTNNQLSALNNSNIHNNNYLTNSFSQAIKSVSHPNDEHQTPNPQNIEMADYVSSARNYNTSRQVLDLSTTRAAEEPERQIVGRVLDNEETSLIVPVDDPPEILESELWMSKGQVHYEFGKYDESLKYCTQGIEVGRQFNPSIRQECLRVIQNILEQQINIKTKKFAQMQKDTDEFNLMRQVLHDFQNSLQIVKLMIQDTEAKAKKDLIFLQDYSSTMDKRNKNLRAVDTFIKIYSMYVTEVDRLAFVQFNHNIDVAFELKQKGKNDIFIEKFLNDAKYCKCEGDKALYNAIHVAIKLFEKAEPMNNSRWIVTVTDDTDNYSRIDEEQLKELFLLKRVKLIIIGLNLNNTAIQIYSKLCQSIGGAFIESPNSEDFKVAFQSITKMEFATDQQADYVDEKFD